MITPDWLQAMAGHAVQEEVGVGARLLYPDGTLQHGGVIVNTFWSACGPSAMR